MNLGFFVVTRLLLLAAGVFLPGGTMAQAKMEDGWYVFEANAPTEEGVFGMGDWSAGPAGEQGRIERRGDRLVYGGDPIRLWGINNCFAACAPEAELAERRARFYAKYGINSVRLHKYADGSGWAGILTEDSFTEFDPAALERMDYYMAQLKERGIFVKLSPTFGPPKLGKKELEEHPWMKEFGAPSRGGRLSVPHSAIFYSEDLQDLHIRQMVNLLRHRNPHTGLTYAEDPMIWNLEIINEQSILFFTSSRGLEASETLRGKAGSRFSAWLQERYGDDTGLREAWGDEALNSFELARNERLVDGTVLPIGNPHFWNVENLDGDESWRRQRHLDTLEFLTSLQVEFYERYVEAVREAGYEGEITGSNWQAGRSLSHFANLWTDSLVGTVDRHNYFGGVRRDRETGEEFVRRDSMLARAGSGMLSSGMQQVSGLPFMLSEWIHVWPSEWGVEGPAIIGAYGMGLQGWDVSYMFQNSDEGRISRELGRQRWDVAAPQIMGVFPAVARQVRRGDVSVSEVEAHLNVHVPSLFRGKGPDFDDTVAQGYDEKAFETGKVGRRALGAARVQVRFTEEWEPTEMFDLSPYEKESALESSTGQLRWHEAGEGEETGGWIVIDTPGTQAVVGFAGGREVRTRDTEIALESPFGALYLTALGKEEELIGAERILVTAIARARNTGQQFSEEKAKLLENGTEPVLMEPVRASIRLARGGRPVVRVLDHDGRPTDRTVPVKDGFLHIDTGRDRSPYYLIDYTGGE